MDIKKFKKGKHEYVTWGGNIKEVRKMKEQEAQNQAKQQPPQTQLKIDIDDATSQGTYVNFALISHSETEFLIDCMFMPPGQNKAKVKARLISNPQHTKRLAMALIENVKKYESRFGEIKVTQPIPPSAKFPIEGKA
ncbi:DUF3467 domain-containing protein [Elusimicrobiota bacterium]